MSFSPSNSFLNHTSDFSNVFIKNKYPFNFNEFFPQIFQEQDIKISSKDLSIEENTFFSSIFLKYPNLLVKRNILLYPTTLSPSAAYFSGRSLKLSDRMSIHLIERSSNIYTVKRKKDLFTLPSKGNFFDFFLGNLINLVSNFSGSFCANNFSNSSFETKKKFLFFSNHLSDVLNINQFFYFSFLKKYVFLRKFYFYFYLRKNILRKASSKLTKFKYELNNNFKLEKNLYLKNFLSSKFLNVKSMAVFFFIKKFKKLFYKVIYKKRDKIKFFRGWRKKKLRLRRKVFIKKIRKTLRLGLKKRKFKKVLRFLKQSKYFLKKEKKIFFK